MHYILGLSLQLERRKWKGNVHRYICTVHGWQMHYNTSQRMIYKCRLRQTVIIPPRTHESVACMFVATTKHPYSETTRTRTQIQSQNYSEAASSGICVISTDLYQGHIPNYIPSA